MSNCRPRSRRYKPCSRSDREYRTLGDIVQTYLDHNAPQEARYLRYYSIQRSLPDAVSKAALALLPTGKRFSHQRRIPGEILARARDLMLKLNYRNVKSFDHLYELLSQTLLPIRGIGPLTIYDTAHRLGAYLRLSPKHVYIHAGVRIGAKALRLSTRERKFSIDAFPPALRRLRPEQIEDCLCIYKQELRQRSLRLKRNRVTRP
jgi:hypothetical protein